MGETNDEPVAPLVFDLSDLTIAEIMRIYHDVHGDENPPDAELRAAFDRGLENLCLDAKHSVTASRVVEKFAESKDNDQERLRAVGLLSCLATTEPRAALFYAKRLLTDHSEDVRKATRRAIGEARALGALSLADLIRLVGYYHNTRWYHRRSTW